MTGTEGSTESLERSEIFGLGSCAYVDALGSSIALAELATGKKEDYDKLAQAHDDSQEIIDHTIQTIKDALTGSAYIGYQVFSDATFGFAIVEDAGNARFYAANTIVVVSLLAAAHQIAHVYHRRLVRGGITTGDLYKRKNIFLGLPISQAVGIEHSVAQDATILVSKGSETYLRYAMENCSDSDSVASSLLRDDLFLVDDAGRVIVNPLVIARPNAEGKADEVGKRMMEQYYLTIRSGLNRFELEPSIYSKYGYQRDLFNWNVENRVKVDEYQIKVPSSDISRTFRRFRDT